MKYVKMLGLLTIAGATLMAFTNPASATITSPPGTVYNGNFEATSTNVSTHGSVKIACKHSMMGGGISSGSTTISSAWFEFNDCGSDTKISERFGTLTFSSSGEVRSTGAETTVQLHRSVFGFPITTHCIYKTNNTSIGTITEGVNPPVLHIGSSPVPEVATDGSCGNDMVWTGTYTIIVPKSGIVIH